jgi:hypothetical protein
MSVHDDTLQGLQEALEYAKGNLQLKSTVAEVNDDEIKFFSIYGKLSEANKLRMMDYANELLRAM